MKIFLLTVISIYMLKSSLCQDFPEITRKILPDIRRVGETGMLNCTVARQSINTVEWYRVRSGLAPSIITRNDAIVIEDKYNTMVDGWPRYTVVKTPDGQQFTYSLIVRRLQFIDNGTYLCQLAVRNTGITLKANGEIIVQLPPSIILTSTSTTATVLEGTSTNLTCDASGYPTPNITWVRTNGRNLPAPHNKFAKAGRFLQLPNIRAEARGVYRCIANNNVIPIASQDITLYVMFKPTARPVQTSYGQMPNMYLDVTIQCIIAGYPQPVLKWYKRTSGGREEVQNDVKHALEVIYSHGQTLGVSEYWLTLLIRVITANDFGIYECEGSNSYGAGKSVVEVYETSECQGANCILSPRRSDCICKFCNFYLVLIGLFFYYL